MDNLVTIEDRIAAVLAATLDEQKGSLPDRYADWIDTDDLAAAVVEDLDLNHAVWLPPHQDDNWFFNV